MIKLSNFRTDHVRNWAFSNAYKSYATSLLLVLSAEAAMAKTPTTVFPLVSPTLEANDDKATSSIPANIKELNGKQIDYDHYKDYVTVGRPWEETDKMFLLYNIGTGKFLNVGSYWGTHAVLSDVPRPFWLQRRNEKYQNGQVAYLRYPESFAETGTFLYDFFTLPTYQIGAKEGKKLSYVKYNYVRLVNTSDNSYETLLENKQGDGTAITLADSKAIDFDNQRIEAEIDLKNVKETYDSNMGSTSGGKIENIFSVGQDISKWAIDGSSVNLHLYASKTSTGIYEIRLNFLSKDYREGTHKKAVQIKDGSIAKIVIAKGSITVNGVECRPGGTTDNYTNPTQHILALTDFQIGSKIGDTHNEAVYSSVKKISYEKTAEDKETDLLSSIDKDDIGKFEIPVTGSLNNRSIEATIDLSTCGNNQENILSIGTYISDWGNSDGVRAENIHFYYTKSDKKLNIDVVYRDGDTNAETGYKQYSTTINSSELTISLSSDGLKLNGTTFDITSDSKSKHVLDYLTNTATSFGIGSKDTKTTTATYKRLSYIDHATTEKVETPLYEADNASSDGSWMKEVSLDLASGESLVADIDITDCKTLKQDLLSIGNDISSWSKDTGKHNLHIYLRKNDFSDHNLYIEYVDENYSDEMKHAFTVKKDETTGKAILHVEMTKNALLINDERMFTDESPMPTISYSRDRAGNVVKFEQYEGNDRIFKLDEYGKYIFATDNDDNADGIYRPTNGYIYSQTDVKQKTFSYFITSKFEQESDDKKNQGVFLGWAPYLSNNNRWGAIGLYGDRDLPQDEVDKDVAVDATQWFFEPVNGYTEDGKPVNVYKLRLNMLDVKVPYRLGELGYNKYDFNTQSGDFYLQATSEQVFGYDLCNYGGGIDLNASSKVEPEDYTEVDVLNTYPDSKPELGYWKLIDVEEYYDLFKAANTEMSQMLDLTFQLRDPDFSRLNAELPNWKMDEGLTDKIRIGYDNYNKKTISEIDYTQDDGTETDANSQSASNHARYMGVDIKGDDAKGNFYQTVTLYNAGWYAIRCGGFSSAGASLFAQYGNEVVQQPLHQLTQKEYDFLNKTSGMVWPYENGMPMYNAIVAMNDELAGGDGTVTGKDGAKVVEKYTNQLVFFVDPDMLTANNGSIDIIFGISLSSGGNIDLLTDDGGSTSSSDNEENPYTASAWTVFDNFHLLFGGNDGEPFLILDEDDENVDHLDNTIHKYRSGIVDGKDINKKLYLHRTFTADKWNSIMLPVGLTKAQYDEMFKEVNEDGTTKRVGSKAAPLAELTELTDRTINFTTVKEETQYEGKDANGSLYDETRYWLKPMTPYIVKPTISEGSDTKGYTAHLYTWESQGTQYLEKNVGGKKKAGEKSFVIEHINMVEGVVKAEQNTDITTFGSKWNFGGMTTQVYTIKDGKTELADCPYVMKGQVADQNGTMTAYGHLAKNFTLDSNGKRQLIENRAAMADSYSISGNKLTYMKSGAASKGFRCWFQYNKPTSSSASAKPMLVLDGIDMTTSIDDIIANDESLSPIARFAQGIYTMDGRMVSKEAGDIKALPKGMYIVNGKKQIVK